MPTLMLISSSHVLRDEFVARDDLVRQRARHQPVQLHRQERVRHLQLRPLKNTSWLYGVSQINVSLTKLMVRG